MTYKIVYTRSAFKDIQKIDSVAKKRIKKKIEEFTINPIKSAKRLTSSNLGTYRWRVGNYRIIFDVDKNNIVILRIGHRKEIYK
ncbi:MAG: type II toxin-antitoxin system mRNA interferase toxin, RelE/StbE family [Candidatus Levybacteria bacterium CG10_big_fil_rev_8_21_14_0_10_35_13]|nr:MAG: type II toxin-antitoxin system mRNA interferase toxin, RelE/StbE family [Candidatus Levybacteria bacterium CG10_big_fil_rev_8_21_14_0_10_35_13]